MNTEDYLRRLRELAARDQQRRREQDDSKNDFRNNFKVRRDLGDH
jgi:hypothetical protein